jgi:hypothetical protein
MEWLVTGFLLLAAVTVLPWWLATSSNAARKGGGDAHGFMSGLAEQLDPHAAMIREETEKREAMEGEEDSGAPPDGDRSVGQG